MQDFVLTEKKETYSSANSEVNSVRKQNYNCMPDDDIYLQVTACFGL